MTDTGTDGLLATTGQGSIVSFDDVTRRFEQVTAVDRLSLQIGNGQTVALLGPNGAGKTTSVELLLGLRTPDRGVVRLFGGPPAAAVAAGRVGAMLQNAGLPQGGTVAELIGLIRGLYPYPLPVADTRPAAGRPRGRRRSAGAAALGRATAACAAGAGPGR
jgi:ABC-2 type transport system ATP-binding protein